MPVAIEQQSGEQARTPHPLAGAAVARVGCERGLNDVPQRRLDDRLVLSRLEPERGDELKPGYVVSSWRLVAPSVNGGK